MAPSKTADAPDWSSIAKWALGIIGAMLTMVVAMAGAAAEKQARALDQLKEAVYNSQAKSAVLETKVDNINTRVLKIEARLDSKGAK